MIRRNFEGKFEKLPQWAQREIRRLQELAEGLATDAANLMGAKPTAVRYDPYRPGAPIYLQEHTEIVYTVDGLSMAVSFRDGEVYVRADYKAAVNPQSQNVVTIKNDKDDA